MPLKIIRATEPIVVNHVNIALFGEPGIGKTSLANSCDRPITLDFDMGAQRSAYRKDVVQIPSWSFIEGMEHSDFDGYRTAVIDTGGRMLDRIAETLIGKPKMSFNGALSQQGFGQMAAIAKTFFGRLRGYGLDVMIICHNKEDKAGDSVINRPDMQGSSKNEMLKFVDQLGFFHSVNNKRTLDFEPSDSWIGKDSAGIGRIEIPHLSTDPTFGADLIARIKKNINDAGAAAAETARQLDEWYTVVEEAPDADGLNGLLDTLAGMAPTIQKPAKQILWNRARTLGIGFNVESKKFVAATVKQADTAAA